MPSGLRRFHESRQSHFITFSCYYRQANFLSPETCDLLVQCLEDMRRHFTIQIYGYVVMPEHVHLLINEPNHETPADAMLCCRLLPRHRPHCPDGTLAVVAGTAATPGNSSPRKYFSFAARITGIAAYGLE